MSLVGLKQLLRAADAPPYALVHFNVCSLEMLEGVVRAAEATQTGVIIGFAARHMSVVNSWAISGAIIERLRHSAMPFVFHLDHANSWEVIQSGIQMGCTSVMIDGSHLPLEQNIELTRGVVDYAHSRGVAVEGEIGGIGGIEGEVAGDGQGIVYTDPQEAERFAAATGVDLLAVAIGTAHGLYRGQPKLRFDVLEHVRKNVRVPLVLHGGTGIDEEDLVRLIRGGIRKVNVFTELSLAVSEQIRDNLQRPKGIMGVTDILEGVTDKVDRVSKRFIQLCNLRIEEAFLLDPGTPAAEGDSTARQRP